MQPRLALLLAALAIAAGCTAPTPSPGDPATPALRYGPMLATFTPAEPNELPGQVRVGWSAEGFGVVSDAAAEFPTGALRVGGALFVTYAGMGWLHYTEQDPRAGAWPAQALALDLRGLLEQPGARVERTGSAQDARVEARGSFRAGDLDVPYHAVLTVQGDLVVAARVEAEGARESPYALEPGPALGLRIARPGEVMDPDDAAPLNIAAGEAHAVLVGLVSAYARNHAGLLPERLTPDDLRVELVASGQAWPDNPFTDAPLRAAEEHGGFRWTRCEPTVGHYAGYGWDGPLAESKWGGRDC
ncbi:MAG TPA: hypothetical protein VGR28_15515 [Candidatus Thermoplasmatota archaeon]|nr:hypothetical protein [Candidatus Thermoplasmatota archaeon]